MRILKMNTETIFCIAPEGQGFENGQLGFPSPGTGKLIYQIQGKERRIIPSGVWEENGSIILKFGKSYMIEESKSRKNIDSSVSETVMRKISEQLPNSF